MQKMIGYAQPISCQFSNAMDCNGNSWAHQQKTDQNTLEDRCPELSKLLNMDQHTSAIAQLQRVALNHLPDVPSENQSLPRCQERAVTANCPQEPRNSVHQGRLSQSREGSPLLYNNSVTTHPCQTGTTSSPSNSSTTGSDGPVVPLYIKRVTDAQTPLQNGEHLQNGDVMQNERPLQNGRPNRIRRTGGESKGGATPVRDREESEATKDKGKASQIKIREEPEIPIDLQMSCEDDDLDDTQKKVNEQYTAALRGYHLDMARYRHELEKHFRAKHGLDKKRKAGSPKDGADDVILVSRGVQASEVTERDTLIAPAIELDLASGNQREPSTPDSRVMIPTTQTRMHLSHSTPRNRFQRHLGNLVSCTTTTATDTSPSTHQNTRSPLTESTSSPLMSPASSSQTPSPLSAIPNLDGPVPGLLPRDRRAHPSQMPLPRFPSNSTSFAAGANLQLNRFPPPFCQSGEGMTGESPQQPHPPFSLVQPPVYPEVPPNMVVPGQMGGYHPPPYPTGQTTARPPNQGQPSESGSSGSDLPPNGHGHPSKRRRRSSSGNRNAKRPKGQEVTLNPRVNVSQSGHTVMYRPEDQVTAHFEESYKKIMQRDTRFSPPNVSVRHPWQPSIPPYPGGMKQNSQAPNTQPSHSLLRDHLTRQPMWPYGQLPQHQGTSSRMPQPYHHNFAQFAQRPGGNGMPRPFHPESYNGHLGPTRDTPVNHMSPYGGLDWVNFHRKPGDCQGMPPYMRGAGDKNQPTNSVIGPDSQPRPIMGQSSPTYLPPESNMQMFGGLQQGGYRFPGFPMNGPLQMSRPDGMPNLTPISEPNRQSLPARAHVEPPLSRDDTFTGNSAPQTVKNFHHPQQNGSAVPANNSSFGSRAPTVYRFSPQEEQRQVMMRRQVMPDDREESSSHSQPSDVLDLSGHHRQKKMPQGSKVHNADKQRNSTDTVRMSPPESHQQEPVMPKIVSVTTEQSEPFPPTMGPPQDAVHHGRNKRVDTCPTLVPVSQMTARQSSGSDTRSNKEKTPHVGNSKTADPSSSPVRPYHQLTTSLEAVPASEPTTLSEHSILSVPRLVRNERRLPRVVAPGEEFNRTQKTSLPSRDCSPNTHRAVSEGSSGVQSRLLTGQTRREVDQMEQANSKTSPASASSNHRSSAKQRHMPALLRIPKIRKPTTSERFPGKDTSQSSSTTTTTASNTSSTSKQRDEAGTIHRTTTTTSSSGASHLSALASLTSGVSSKDVSMPAVQPTSSSPFTPAMLPNLIPSQGSQETSLKDNARSHLSILASLTSGVPSKDVSMPAGQPTSSSPFTPAMLPNLVPSQGARQTSLTQHQQSGPAVTGASATFFSASPSLCTQPLTLPPPASATYQNPIVLTTTDPTLQSAPVPTILTTPIVIPNSVSLINSATVDQPSISITTNETVDHPQVVAGTVRSVATESEPKSSAVSPGLLRSRSQLESYLEQATPVAHGSTHSGVKSAGKGSTKDGCGQDDKGGNERQKDVEKQKETSATLLAPHPSSSVSAALQETEESKEQLITIPVPSISSNPEVDKSKDESTSKGDEHVNIFDQVATFVSSLAKETDLSATLGKAPKEGDPKASNSSVSRETKHQLNGSVQKNPPVDATKNPTTSPSGRLKNCTLRLVPRRPCGDKEKSIGTGQSKHASQSMKDKRRKHSHPKSSSSKSKVDGVISSKWKKYYGYKKGRLPSHQHNTRFRVVCYHCENLMADNITYMDHVEEVIEKSCPATKIKKLCKICFKAQSGDLQQHIEESHIKGCKYVCQICNVKFPDRKDLKTHMKRTHKGLSMPYICKICLYQTSFHADLKYHFITAHRGSKALLCHFCTKVLYSSRSFLSHFTKHYARQMGVQCPDCKLLFLSNSACKEHMNNDHQKFNWNDKDGLPPYKSFYLPKSPPKSAQSCTKLVSSTMSSLNEEVILVPEEEEEVKKAWKCLECGGSYVHLAEHLFTEYKCQNCPYVTHCSSAFTQHVVAFHSSFQDAPKLHPVKKTRVFGGQLLRCRKCGYKTAYATNMAKHIVCCPEGVSVIDSFDYLRTRALKEIAMRGRIADNSDNVPEVIAVESID